MRSIKTSSLCAILLLLCHKVTCMSLYTELLKIYEKNGLRFREEMFLENQPILGEYDFIVVGSGPAGIAVASRLSEIAEWKILLLEAGVEGTIYNDMPSLSPFFITTNYSWGYKTEKQSNICLGLEDGICLWPAGKGVGGGSIMNGMLYTRGPSEDYDSWAQLGNDGWSYNEILKYFLKAERMTIPHLKHSPYHSRMGAVDIEYPFPSPVVDKFIKAMVESGYQWVDYNNPNTPIGVSLSQVTMKKGRRFSAAKAYLSPIKYRSNLHIAKNAFVTRVLVDPKSKKAIGITFLKNGLERRVYTRKEVIVSAGAFNTPKLLMLSGIGPENHLDQIGIPVIMNLPVGDNLQEHLTTVGATFLINTTDSYTLRKLMQNSVPNLLNWLNYGRGPIANNGAEALAYIPINGSRPEVEFIFVPLTLASDSGILLRKTMGITDETYSTFSELENVEGISIWPMGMYPESKGQVRLNSNDPLDPPKLIPNFLENPRDTKIIVEGIKAAIELTKTNSFQKIGAKLFTKPLKGCEHEEFGTDDYFECVLRTVPVQLHHQCCTAKMGRYGESVVDSSLRVHGVAGLRVADTSVMPTITGAHTMATAYMIGEKAADLIKKDWFHK